MISRRGIPVVGPDGVTYRSINAAARALGFHHSTVRHHLATYGNLQLLGCGSTPCVHNGVSYSSLEECARALGLRRHTLAHHLQRYGNLDRAGIGSNRGNPGNAGRRIPLTVGPLSWPRRKDAANELGVSVTTLSRWVSRSATPRQRERLMGLVMCAAQRRTQRERAVA